MNATILIIIIVILVCIATVAFLLLKRRSREMPPEEVKGRLADRPEAKTKSFSREMPPEEVEGCLSDRPIVTGADRPIVIVIVEGADRLEEIEEIEAFKAERRRESFGKKYRISIAHPKLLSKRYSSRFLVQIYLPEMRSKVSQVVAREFKGQNVELVRDSELETGQRIKMTLFSPSIVFSEPVIKKLDKAINTTNFIAKPNDDCHPGIHQVVLSLSDPETQIEYQSISFTVKVADFAFDHVSRPLLSKAASVTLGIGSLAMFILTGLEQVDKTFGLTAGTAAAVLTSTVLIRWWSLFQQPKVTHTS